MMKAGYGAYKGAQTETKDQGKLILVTYDIAIKHAKLALEVFDDKKKIEERAKHIFKIQDALEELQIALNMDAGGEIAANLFQLYTYMYNVTVEANIRTDKTKIEEVLQYLETLREAWAQANLKSKAESAPELNLENAAV
ncbi:MAG: flagellar export chaperone FliS [Chitinispirillales bacterium]|jgi:flagellar protein FliS|nr:flagellar export chaperone FliS [Chitinispirillales bacterium]